MTGSSQSSLGSCSASSCWQSLTPDCLAGNQDDRPWAGWAVSEKGKPMDLQELEQEFQTAAAVVQLARVDLFRVAEVVVAENRVLEAEKISALQAGRVDGKNETERKAQMAEILQHEIENVASAEKAERKA